MRSKPVSPAATVAVLSVVWMVVNTQRLTAASFVGASPIMADFGITAGLAGLLVSAYFPPYGLLQIPLGIVVDRVAPRRILLWSVGLLAASNLLFALAPAVEWAILARVAVGLSSAPVFISCLKICSDLSLREYPRRLGIVVTAGSVGMLIGLSSLPLALAALPWRTVGLLLVGQVLLLLPILALAPLPRPTMREPVSVADLASAVREQVRSARFWWLTLPAMAWCGSYFGVLGWLPRYARDVLRSDPALTGVLPGLFSLGLLVGATLFGASHTKWRPLGPWLFFGGAICFALAVGLLPLLDGLGAASLLYGLALLMGLLFGAFFVWIGLVRDLVVPSRLGTVTGLINGLTFLPSFVEPWLFGALLDLVDRPQVANPTYSARAYAIGFGFLAAGMGLGLLGALLCGRLRARSATASGPLEAGQLDLAGPGAVDR